MEFLEHLKSLRTEIKGDLKLYFDPVFKNNVIAVADSRDQSFTYVRYNMEDSQSLFYTVNIKGQMRAFNFPIKSTFVIPSVLKVRSATFMRKTEPKPMLKLIPDFLYTVVDHGMLSSPLYAGSDFTNLPVTIIVANSAGRYYSVSMRCAKGVKGFDGKPSGSIEGTYKFKSPLIVAEAGVEHYTI